MKALKEVFPLRFIIFSFAIFLLIFILQNINQRFWLNDFKVYYSAAKALMEGQPVYGVLFALGSGYFKYAPFVALITMPFCLFQFEVAIIIQYFLLATTITFLFVATSRLINEKLIGNRERFNPWILFVAFGCTFNHLFREVHLGNINVVLLFLVVLSLMHYSKNRIIIPGILLAIVLMTKPFFIIILLPFLFYWNIRLLVSVFISCLIFLLLPSIVAGIQGNIDLHKNWINTMFTHNSAFPSFNTFDYLIGKFMPVKMEGSIQPFILILVFILSFILFRFLNKPKGKNNKLINQSDLVFQTFVLLAILPNIFKTDTQHFLLSLPLILIILFYLFESKNWIRIIGFGILTLIYGWNLSDIFGRKLSGLMDEYGFLGISNLMLIGLAIFIYLKKQRPGLILTTKQDSHFINPA